MDLRDWLDTLRKIDKLQEIDLEVDWNLEVSCIVNMANRVVHKGVLFNNIKGYPEWRMFGATTSMTTRRRRWATGSLILGLPEDTPKRELEKEIARRMSNPILPTEVAAADAPCKEIIKIGKEANIFDLPVPYVHATDGGRYLTNHAIIQKDPDIGWTNYALYRVECIAPRKLASLLLPNNQGGQIFFQKYAPRRKNCPFCIAIGGDPALFWTYVTFLPVGVCELDIAGGLRGEPIRVVRAETNDLLVPADAEVVIEGEILVGKVVDEGPFAEFSGYVHGRMRNPEMRVDCITHRKNPILPISVQTMTAMNENILMGTPLHVSQLKELREIGIKAVDSGGVIDQGVMSFRSVKDSDNIGDIIRMVEYGRRGAGGGNWEIVCNPEVNLDIGNRGFREFALNTDPRRDFHISDMDALNVAWYFFTSYEERQKNINQSKVWIDATTGRKPKELKPKNASFEAAFPDSLRKKVGENWRRLGFDRPFEEIEPVDPDWFMKA